MTAWEQLEQAIAHLEAQRATLGDAVVDASIAALREKLTRQDLAASEPGPPPEQRKQVTVLFCDLVGFTPLAERMDPEEVREVLNVHFQPWREALARHDNVLDEYIGDAVMAVFGIPVASEDDPENAIRVALAVRDGLSALNDRLEQRYGVRLAMRVGINTGPVLVGAVGRKDLAVTGDTVNLAQRLETAAPPDGILISHDTYRHVRGVFDVLVQEPIRVKGKSEPIQTYLVQRAKPRAFRKGTRGVEGIATRMVGRDAELLTLQDTFRDAMAGPETRIVTIVGEAGVGKSRLLYEFEKWIELLSEDIWCFKGRAAPEMQAVPRSVIRNMFVSYFEILESDSAAAVLTKFRTGMEGILSPMQADLVGHFVGFDFSTSQAVRNLLGSASFGQMARAYLLGYFRATAGEPMVILLEDIHWADAGSLELIDHLVTAIPHARRLVVCLARPSLYDRHPDWGVEQEAHTRLDLEPLSRRDSQALVGEILQKVTDIPADLRDLVVDGAEGNPFYVEELIKMLIEDGVIQRGEARWQVELERLGQIRVPPTLTGVLQARLDGLPWGEKALLQRASVVGRLFWDTAVAELEAGEAIALDRSEIAHLLDAVRGRELVFRRARSAFAGTQEYIFKHALLRDVTYETVLLRLRRVYHAQVARWLETTAGERSGEYLDLIAGHYELAGNREKAAEYLQRSGGELLEVGAFQDAIDRFERVRMLLPEDDAAARGALLVKLGHAYSVAVSVSVAERHLADGLRLAHEAGDTQAEVSALILLGYVVRRQGRYDEARVHLETALTLAREIDDPRHMAGVSQGLGWLAWYQGDIEKAEGFARDTLARWQEIGDRRKIGEAFLLLAAVVESQGEYGTAKRYKEESLELARALGDRGQASISLNNLGEGARKQGEYEEAAQYYQEALAIGRELGSRTFIAMVANNLGHVYVGLGENDLAWGYLCEGLRESLAAGRVLVTLEALIGVAWLRTKTGRHAEAAKLLGLVLGHPALNEDCRQYAAPVLAMVREALPADELEAALERGKAMSPEAIATGILEDAVA